MGTALVSKLLSEGHTVRVLTRDAGRARRKLPQQGCTCYGPEEWSQGIKGATAAVNLAGATWQSLLLQHPADCCLSLTLQVSQSAPAGLHL